MNVLQNVYKKFTNSIKIVYCKKAEKMYNRHTMKKPGIVIVSIIVILTASLGMAGCGQEGGDVGFDVNPITAESLEGLILEGEGPIPARLIYQSRNSLSTEEDRLVLEVIAQELDRLMELAGRLDEAVTGETAATDRMMPEDTDR